MINSYKVKLDKRLKDGGVGSGGWYFREGGQRKPEKVTCEYNMDSLKPGVTSHKGWMEREILRNFSSKVDPQFNYWTTWASNSYLQLTGLSGFHKVPLISLLITCLIQLFLNQDITSTPDLCLDSCMPHPRLGMTSSIPLPSWNYSSAETRDQPHLKRGLALYPRTHPGRGGEVRQV